MFVFFLIYIKHGKCNVQKNKKKKKHETKRKKKKTPKKRVRVLFESIAGCIHSIPYIFI